MSDPFQALHRTKTWKYCRFRAIRNSQESEDKKAEVVSVWITTRSVALMEGCAAGLPTGKWNAAPQAAAQMVAAMAYWSVPKGSVTSGQLQHCRSSATSVSKDRRLDPSGAGACFCMIFLSLVFSRNRCRSQASSVRNASHQRKDRPHRQRLSSAAQLGRGHASQ